MIIFVAEGTSDHKKTGFLPKPAIASGREALLGHRSGGPRRSPPATTTAATKTASRRVLFLCTQSNVHASSVVGILLTENGFGCAWSQKARKGRPSYWVWGYIVKASTRKHKTKGYFMMYRLDQAPLTPSDRLLPDHDTHYPSPDSAFAPPQRLQTPPKSQGKPLERVVPYFGCSTEDPRC